MQLAGAGVYGGTSGQSTAIEPVSDVGKAINKEGLIDTVTNIPGNTVRGLSDAGRAAGQGNLEPVGEIVGSLAVPVLVGKGVGAITREGAVAEGTLGEATPRKVAPANTTSGNAAPYDPKTARADLEAVHGDQNVASTTVANNPVQRVNSDPVKGVTVIENSSGKAVQVEYKDPTTGQSRTANVPYDSRGLPVFDDVAQYTTKIDTSVPYEKQFGKATKDLRDAINSGKVDATQFTPEQLAKIQAGSDKIPGLTWHHNAQSAPNNMQLVPTPIHNQVTHLGQGSLSQGK